MSIILKVTLSGISYQGKMIDNDRHIEGWQAFTPDGSVFGIKMNIDEPKIQGVHG